MTLGDDLARLPSRPPPAPRRGDHPQGFEPGVAWTGREGTLTTGPLTEAPTDWTDLLAVWGFDPATHEVVEPVQYRAWDAADGEGGVRRMFYYKAAIRLRKAPQAGADVDELLRMVRRHRRSPRPPSAPARAFVVCLSDWQVGKADGDGVEGTTARLLAAVDAVTDRVKELRRNGRELSHLYVMGLGDMIEACDGHYPQQAWRTSLTLTEQVRVTRTLIVKALTRWAPLFDSVTVAAVQGNHGENRSNGKSHTDFGDNHDTDVFASASEVLAANPDAYGHVSFVFPQGQEITLTLDVCGTVVGLAHGHQFKSAATVMTWWANQAHGRQPIGDADLLLTGHYHHLRVIQDRKTWMQVPAMDGGSDWWRHLSGNDAPPGMLTVVVGGGGWSDLAVL